MSLPSAESIDTALQALHAIEEAIRSLETQRQVIIATLPQPEGQKAVARMPKPWLLREGGRHEKT